MPLIRAPRNPRDLFEAFRFYVNRHGLPSILDRIDFTGVGPAQVHYACFGELRTEADAVRHPVAYDARQQLEAFLASARFQKGLVAALLAAFSEKRRLLFVHVPKCAGADLTQHLVGQYPSVDQRLVEPEWMAHSRMFVAIKRLIEYASFSDDIFVHGHTPLRHYVSAGQLRFGDAIFAILRDPTEMVISKVNYVITRFQKDSGFSAVDTKGWLRFIDRSLVETALATGEMMTLARHILHSAELTARNTVCDYLGRETAESCYALCAQADAEITDIAHYAEWLKARWGVTAETRRNASVPHISLADLNAEDRQRIESVTLEDRKVFDALRRSLDANRSLSAIGAQLGHFAA